MGRCQALKDGGGECEINNSGSGVDERHKTLVSVSKPRPFPQVSRCH